MRRSDGRYDLWTNDNGELKFAAKGKTGLESDGDKIFINPPR